MTAPLRKRKINFVGLPPHLCDTLVSMSTPSGHLLRIPAVGSAREFLLFGLKEAQACIFAGSFFILLFLSNHIPLGGFSEVKPRSDLSANEISGILF